MSASLHAHRGTAAGRAAPDPAPRHLGSEVEYGVTPAACGHPRALVDLMRHGRALPGGFAVNGSRIYLDAGEHPEVATPECTSSREAAAYDHAGEQLIAQAAAQRRTCPDPDGDPVLPAWQRRVRVLRNNLDADATPYGTHENYQVDRAAFGPLERAASALAPLLVARILLTGAGTIRVTEDHPARFLVSQRAWAIEEVVSSGATSNRPMVSTRDEPLAPSATWRRVHITCGDTAMSHTATWRRLALTRAAVAALELAPRALDHLRLAAPVRALRRAAADPDARLHLASGATATCAQLLHGVVAVLDELAMPVSELTGEDPREVLAEVTSLLDGYATDGARALAGHVDWATKRQLLARIAEREGLAAPDPGEPTWSHRDLAHPRLRAVDLLYHDVTDGPAVALRRRGGLDVLFDAAQLGKLALRPPPSGRAHLRGELVRQMLAAGLGNDRASVNWDRAWYGSHTRRTTVHLPDPADGRAHQTLRLRRAMAADLAGAAAAADGDQLGDHLGDQLGPWVADAVVGPW